MSFIPPESLEAAEANRRADQAYNAKGDIDFSKLQDSTRKALGMKPFVSPDKEPVQVASFEENSPTPRNTKSLENQDASEKVEFQENKYLPIIKRLSETGQISKETLTQIQTHVKENDGKLDFNAIEGLETQDRKIIEGYISNIKGEKSDEKNLKEFSSDIKDLEGRDYMQGIDLDNSEVLNVIGKNYLKFPDKEGKFDVEQDLSIAILSTKSEILSEVKNINTSSETYKVAMRNIDSKDVSKQMEGIDNLYHLAYANEGKLAKGILSKYRTKRIAKLKKQAGELENELQEATTQKNDAKLKILEKRKQSIINEMAELTGLKDGKPVEGDVFESGELDIGPEQKESPKKAV